MTALKNSLILITLCLGLAAAQQEDGDARLLFSNYTSGNLNKYKKILFKSEIKNSNNKLKGLLKLTTVNSTTYGLISLIVGGAALAIAFGYLITVSPTFQSQFQSHYRSFNDGESKILTEKVIENMKFTFQSHQLT